MKARIATVLSLTGVLVAGAAAAVVNAQVLRAAEQSMASDTMISLVLDSSSTHVASSTTVSSLPTPSSEPVVPTRSVYQLGDVAMITLDTADGVLSVVSAVPNPGWTVLATSSLDANNIEVQLQGGASVVSFRANLLLGAVTTAVEVSSAEPSTTEVPALAAPVITVHNTSVVAVPVTSSPPSTTDDSDDTDVTDVTDDSHGGGEEEEDD